MNLVRKSSAELRRFGPKLALPRAWIALTALSCAATAQPQNEEPALDPPAAEAGADGGERPESLPGGAAPADLTPPGDSETPPADSTELRGDSSEASEGGPGSGEASSEGDAGPGESSSEGGSGSGEASDAAVDSAQAADEADAAQPLETRLETLLELNRLKEEQRYADALPVGERLVELTEEEFGAQSLEAAEAYQAVAAVQREAEEHEQSEQSYLHAVELIRSVDGTFSELAIAPLIGLGDNYHDAGQYLNAITAYDEARTINRRVFGLLNERQIPILDRITDSLEELEQYAEADEQQLTILHLAERNYDQGSPEYLEAIYRYAAWLRESGRYHEERAQYSRAQRIIREMHGKDSVYEVRPLREIGNSYRSQRIPEGQGISALRSALEILEMSGADEPLAMAEVLRDIGDWEVAFSKVEPDLELYRRAWRLLGEVENGEALREEWFGDLENVLGEPISQRGLSNDPDALQGHVVVEFDVDLYGRTQNVAVVESEPPGLKDEAVSRAVRRWRFRPFIEDGEVVPKDRLALQFNYRYLPDETETESESE